MKISLGIFIYVICVIFFYSLFAVGGKESDQKIRRQAVWEIEYIYVMIIKKS